MKYPDITTVLLFTILMAPLLRSLAAGRNYVILSMTKTGLLELRLAYGKRRFLETSLADAEPAHRIAFSSVTDGFQLVRTVTRGGRLDDCITSTSSRDITSFVSEFSQTSGNLVKVSEADVMDAYLKCNRTTYPTFILKRDEVHDKSNISSVMCLKRTDSRWATYFPDFRLWARINTSGNSLFIKMFRQHLRVARKTRECKQLYDSAINTLQTINTLDHGDLKDNEDHTTINKSIRKRHRRRHYHRVFQHFISHIHENCGRDGQQEIEQFNVSTPRRVLASDMRDLSRSSEDLRQDANINVTSANGKQDASELVNSVTVHNESVGTLEVLTTPFVPGVSTERQKLVFVTDRTHIQVTDEGPGKYTRLRTDRHSMTGRHPMTGKHHWADRNPGSDRHYESQKQPESNIHQEPGRYKEADRHSVTRLQLMTDNGSKKHRDSVVQNESVPHHESDRNHETEIYVDIDRRHRRDKHDESETHEPEGYNESDRHKLHIHHRTDKHHESETHHEPEGYNESDRHHRTDKHHDSEKHEPEGYNASDRHHTSNRHHRTDKHHTSGRHDEADRYVRPKRHHESEKRKGKVGKHGAYIHHVSHRHHRSGRHHRSDRHPRSGRHDQTYKHYELDRHLESDTHLTSVSLRKLATHISDSGTTSNTEAGTSSEGGGRGGGQETSLRGNHTRSRRDLLTGWMIFPGTKWCGDGDIAEHKQDMGYHSELDMCCRRHDLCPLVIPKLTWKYGIFNYRLHTLSHCRCDRKLRKCLKASSSPLAHLIGQIYFNVIGPECFKFTQKTTCVERLWWGGCQEWSTNKVAYPKRQRRFK